MLTGSRRARSGQQGQTARIRRATGEPLRHHWKSRWPERFAAAVSICGGADENAVAAAWAVPVWAFHGAADRVVRVERSRMTIDALRVAGGIPQYTEYPEVGHDSWTHAFAEPDLLPWLFSHRRGTTADSASPFQPPV